MCTFTTRRPCRVSFAAESIPAWARIAPRAAFLMRRPICLMITPITRPKGASTIARGSMTMPAINAAHPLSTCAGAFPTMTRNPARSRVESFTMRDTRSLAWARITPRRGMFTAPRNAARRTDEQARLAIVSAQ